MKREFFEKYDVITKTEKIIEYGILTDEGMEELISSKGFIEYELMKDTLETELDNSITYYAVANKNNDEPIIGWVTKDTLLKQIEIIEK